MSWTRLLVPNALTWSGGGALARSSSAAGTFLHAVYSSDLVGGVLADDDGPFMGVNYRRIPPTGTTWGPQYRLNRATYHADRVAVAAYGRFVTAAWVQIESIEAYDPSAPRGLWMRVNDGTGDPAAWEPADLVNEHCQVGGSCVTGRVDRPSLAAGSGFVNLAYTDSDTGDIMLATLSQPFQGGTTGPIATTTRQTVEGFAGLPVVAVSGNSTVIAWLADANGTVKARVSLNGGAWIGPSTIGNGATAAPSVDVAGGRAAIAWSTAGGVKVRVRTPTDTAWRPTRTAEAFAPGALYEGGRDLAVDLSGTSTVGVAFTGCRRPACAVTTASTEGIDLAWRQSPDNGVPWSARSLISTSTSATNTRRAASPSSVWAGGQRNVLFARSSADFSVERVVLARGTGTP